MSGTNKPTIFNRYFILVFITSTCFCLAMEMLNVVIPLYVTEDLGKTVAISGLMATFYTVASAVSRPFNGLLTDKFKRRTIMVLGCGLYAVGIFMCGFIPMVVTAFCFRMIQGIGYSAASTANMAASNDVIPKERLEEGVGYFGMSHTIPSILGPILVTALITVLGNRGTQYVIAGICLLATVLALLTNYEKKPEFARELQTQSKEPKGAFVEPTAIVPSLIQFASLFCSSCSMVFFTLFVAKTGLPTACISGFFSTAGITMVICRMIFSRFISRVNPLLLLIPSWVLGIVQCFGMSYAKTLPAFILLGVLYGCCHGGVWMTTGALAVSRAVPQRRGAANATFYLAFDGAIGIGAAVWGALIDRIDFTACYRLSACGYVLVAILAVLVFRKWKHAESTGAEKEAAA